MNVLWQFVWFIVAVSVLVTVHEFGHYWVARRFGFKILRFSVGFGKPLYKRIAGPDRTEYVIASLPLGGYVKMLDEREGPVEPQELHRSFTRKPPWQRIVVLLAGPAFNIAFAILILWGMFWANGVSEVRPIVGDVTLNTPAARAGLKSGDEIVALNGARITGQPDVVFGLLDAVSSDGKVALEVQGRDGRRRAATIEVPDAGERRTLTEPSRLMKGLGFEFWEPFASPVLGEVTPDGPGGHAGLRSGDLILSVDGKALSFRDFVPYVETHAGQPILIHYRRGTLQNSVRLTPIEVTDAGKAVGRIQVAIGPDPTVKYPATMRLHTRLGPVGALAHAASQAWEMTALQARLVWRMVLGKVSFKNLSGPLSIAQFAGESATDGIATFLGFLVLISLSLGFLNLLPIPILDGGQILFQLAEWFKGTPVSERAQMVGQQVGLALLVLLMGVALFNDIVRQFN